MLNKISMCHTCSEVSVRALKEIGFSVITFQHEKKFICLTFICSIYQHPASSCLNELNEINGCYFFNLQDSSQVIASFWGYWN